MSTPTTDAEELFAIATAAYDAVEYGGLAAPQYQIDWECMGADEAELRWRTAVMAVANAVCPEGYTVVPKAEHDRLTHAVDAAIEAERVILRTHDGAQFIAAMAELRRAFAAYQDALGAQP